ncbi:PH domain-containing protein [Nocardia sp. NPDC051030]|uniref:PH domain-containing protein n=1 Tax=Nocardia sp. NPDC051030 TaxID=3155162 RepID=UPI003447F6D9
MGSDTVAEFTTAPAGYWPTGAPRPPSVSLGAGLTLGVIPLGLGVAAVLAGARVLRDGSFEIYGAFGIALACLLSIACIAAMVVGIAMLRPPVLLESDGIVITRGLWTNGLFYWFACSTLCAGLWLLVSVSAGAWLAAALGLILFAVAAVCLWALVHESRARLEIDSEGMRLTVPHRDREFPWDAISDVRLERVRVGSADVPQIEFHCRTAAVVTHRGSRPTAFEKDGPTGRPYRIKFKGLPVRPEALLATIEFMIAHPDERTGLTAREIAATLG